MNWNVLQQQLIFHSFYLYKHTNLNYPITLVSQQHCNPPKSTNYYGCTDTDPLSVSAPISAVSVLNYLVLSEADVESYIVGDAHLTCTMWSALAR